MASSTNRAGAGLDGWRLQDVPNDELMSLLKIPAQEVAAVRAALIKQQRDPAWIAAALDALPAATLAVLSLMVEAGGLVTEDALVRVARDRFGMSVDDCRVAVSPAFARLLMVLLRSPRGEMSLGMVLPAGALIAPLVADLDLYLNGLPAAGFVAAESPACNPRTLLATCVATRHLDVKLTLDGRPHFGAVKRLAKQVGVDDNSIDVLLRIGIGLGLLQVEGEVVRPDLPALAEAAAGRYPRHPALAAAQAQLADGPVASDALVRSLRRRDPQAWFVDPDTLACLPGFAVGTVDGVAAVARRALEGVASGHVTPSFEVFLPPESPLIDVVHVGACCEWVRLDRALVARITKPSVARAVAAGASAGQLLEQLAAAIRHPIPQNVEAAIRDWASGVIAATIATGHVIVIDPAARGRAAAALAELDARELAPGVFVVDHAEELREIARALTQAGLHYRELSSARAPAARAPGPVPAAPAPGAPRLRARVAAWRRGEPFEGVRDDFLDQHRAARAARSGSAGSAGSARSAERPADAAAARPATLLEHWAAKHRLPFDVRNPGSNGIAAVLSELPQREVVRILEECRNLDQLLGTLAKLVGKQGRGKPPPARRPQTPHRPRAPRAPLALLWQQEDLRERLQDAARRGETLALQLAGGVRNVAITQAIRRGTTWMVLGEDIRDDEAVALRLDDIQAIAALPDDFGHDDDLDFGGPGDIDDDDDDDFGVIDDAAGPGGRGELARRPWRPAPGQAPPAGHLPCPCGSGVRYRQCCRDVPIA